jgi:hypothetical protein
MSALGSILFAVRKGIGGNTVRSISRKTAAWAAAAVVAVGAGTAGIVLATSDSSSSGQAARGAAASDRAAVGTPKPLRIVSVSPASGTTEVNGTAAVTVTYNQPPSATTPVPVLSPAIAGAWTRRGDSLVFTPAVGWAASTRVTVTGPDAAESQAFTFKTGPYSTLRLQEILAQLGYLPLTWAPSAGATAVSGNAGEQLAAAYDPPAGSFSWQGGYPSDLHTFWAQGESNTMDRGAVMGFEADHSLTVNGTATARVWTALLTAAAKGQRNTHGYSYAIVSKSQPERLTIWHNGKRVFSSPANTGIPGEPTVDGTFPVYLKLPFQIMSGTNPDGSHYADPVQWVSYFNGGDAVHYFPRGSYGWPQSLGCVELPYGAAKEAYPYLPYGTLVTVS